MAKQHRGATLTAGCLLAIGEFYFFDATGFAPDSTPQRRVLHLAAWVIAIGSLVTCGTRLHAIAKQLRAR
jgi:hypothetical protein